MAVVTLILVGLEVAGQTVIHTCFGKRGVELRRIARETIIRPDPITRLALCITGGTLAIVREEAIITSR